jgi:hypothetical protein
MSIMHCSDFLDHIGEWIEGEEVAGARDHSRQCEHCRHLAEDLATIRLAAVTLPETDTEPSPRLWNSLRAELEREGLIKQEAQSERAGWFAGLFSLRPALALGYVAALAVLGVALSFNGPADMTARNDRWFESTRTSSAKLSAQLQDAEQDEVAALSSFRPDVTEDLRKNLSIVDNDIALCEKSVREEPDNEIARDYLFTAYEQKADLLALISEHGDKSR